MSRRLSWAPLDDDDLLEEILLRLPPQPSSLPRASLVCKRWRGILSDLQFLGRFRKRHRKPPLLGFFTGHVGTRHVFNPVLDSPDRIPAARFSVPQDCTFSGRWEFRGCRDGLAVLINDLRCAAVVWDPLTGQHHWVPFPRRLGNVSRETYWLWHAAAMCVDPEDGHVHGDCFSRPFKLVLMCHSGRRASACAYNSASGVWGNVISTATTESIMLSRPSIMAGNAVHWLFRQGGVLVFDIEMQRLGVIDTPADSHGTDCWSFQLFRAGDDGSLGLALLKKLSIQLWKRKSNSNDVVEWVLLQKTIQLERLFRPRMFSGLKAVVMVGYDEDSNEIVLGAYHGVFMLQIESMQFRKVCKTYTWNSKIFYPYRNFYTAGREVGWRWVNPEL